MNRNNKHKNVQRKIAIGIGYPLLLAAAFCTMVPLLWLISSSFKTANEVFAVPIKWLPKLPSRITSSPYVVTDLYPDITKPASVNKDAWETIKPELENVIWKKAREHIAANPQLASTNLSEDLQTETVQGIWQQHIATLPTEVWNANNESILNTVENAIITETIETIWKNIYKQVTVGTIEIEDTDFKKTKVESVDWESDSATITPIQHNTDASTITGLTYTFQDSNQINLTAKVQSSIPIYNIRSIVLPVRGDASYHHLSLSVSTIGTTYQPEHPFILGTDLKKDIIWRLKGDPSELEAEHIPMQQYVEKQDLIKSVAPPPGSEHNINLQLTIHRPSYLSIVWYKLTSNYRNLWNAVPYNRYFINSVFIATASTLLTLFFCSLAGYGFAKYQFRGKTVLFSILLASMMVPFQVLLVPLFGLMYDIGWLNSYKAIIIPFAVGAFGVFLMRQFIVTIPSELLDAARIDGCSEFGIYYRIVLPIIKPALGALTIYSFLSSWNGYLWPLIILRDEAKYTLPIGLANLVGIYRQEYGMLMAGTLLSLLPIVILFLAMQREFVQGITLGSVKE